MLQDWCFGILHGAFQNAYFGVTQQTKGVDTTIFATIKHFVENASV